MEKTQKQIEFEAAAKPLIKYLAENHNPHTSAIVDSTHAEIVVGEMAFTTNEFLVD